MLAWARLADLGQATSYGHGAAASPRECRARCAVWGFRMYRSQRVSAGMSIEIAQVAAAATRRKQTGIRSARYTALLKGGRPLIDAYEQKTWHVTNPPHIRITPGNSLLQDARRGLAH